MNMLGKQSLRACEFKKLTQHPLTGLCRAGASYDSEVIAAICDLDVESALDMSQMFIELAAEVGEPGVVFRLQHQVSTDY